MHKHSKLKGNPVKKYINAPHLPVFDYLTVIKCVFMAFLSEKKSTLKQSVRV